jgi:hypothetical protein
MLLAPRHHEALLFKRQKIQILNLQKNSKKSRCSPLRLCNFSIWNTLSWLSKKDKVVKIWKEKKYVLFMLLDLGFLLFLLRTQSNVFRIKILYNHSTWSCLQPGIFFEFFWNFEIWIFSGSKIGSTKRAHQNNALIFYHNTMYAR